jgi:hypothetical protein
LNESELLRRLVLAELEKSATADPVKSEVEHKDKQTDTDRMTRGIVWPYRAYWSTPSVINR